MKKKDSQKEENGNFISVITCTSFQRLEKPTSYVYQINTN